MGRATTTAKPEARNVPGTAQLKYWVPALERGLKVLFTLSGSPDPLTVTEIARKTLIQIPNVYRIIYTLNRLGYVEGVRNTKRYRVTPQLLRIGAGYAGSRRLVDIARPHLEALRDRVEGACHLAVRDGLDIVFLLGVTSGMLPLKPLPLGGRLPLYVTTIGAMLLSGLDDDEIRDMYRTHTFNQGEVKTTDDLLRNVRKARREGLLVGKAGTVSGLLTASAPIVDADGRAYAAINIICLESPKNAHAMKHQWGRALVDTARRISIEAQKLDGLIL